MGTLLRQERRRESRKKGRKFIQIEKFAFD
jgi:hypothetical protein